MTNFPELRLFPKESTEFVPPVGQAFGIVSAFRDFRNLEDNLAEHRRLHIQHAQVERFIAYGSVPGAADWSYLLFYDFPTLRSVLEEISDVHIVSRPDGTFLIDRHHSFRLPPYDGRVATIDEYVQALKPGFTTKGYFPRSHLYVEGKLRAYGITA